MNDIATIAAGLRELQDSVSVLGGLVGSIAIYLAVHLMLLKRRIRRDLAEHASMLERNRSATNERLARIEGILLSWDVNIVEAQGEE